MTWYLATFYSEKEGVKKIYFKSDGDVDLICCGKSTLSQMIGEERMCTFVLVTIISESIHCTGCEMNSANQEEHTQGCLRNSQDDDLCP